MTFVHKELARGRWHTFSLAEQLGNVGSELERVISWRKKGNEIYCQRALERMLELIDLTIRDERWHSHRLKELTRMREVLCDLFYGENQYHVSFEELQKYFMWFAYRARQDR